MISTGKTTLELDTVWIEPWTFWSPCLSPWKEKTFSAGGMGHELDKKHGQHILIAGWPTGQVAFQDENQYDPNKLGARIYCR